MAPHGLAIGTQSPPLTAAPPVVLQYPTATPSACNTPGLSCLTPTLPLTSHLSAPGPALSSVPPQVIIYTAVRSGRSGLGFVKDLRRLNVALTRARHALYLVGSGAALRQSATWAALIDDAIARGLSRDVTIEGALRVSPIEILNAIPPTLLDGTPARAGTMAEEVDRSAPVQLTRR